MAKIDSIPAQILEIAILGSEHVGKKTLAKSKFLDNLGDLDYMLTIGMEFSNKKVKIDQTIVMLLIRTFSDKHRWWIKSPKGNLGNNMRGTKGAIVLYDITNSKSLEQIPQWIQIVRDNAGDIPILLVGNKCDLEQQREVAEEQIETIKKEHNIAAAMEISGKKGEKVEKLFLNLTHLILKQLKRR